MVTTIAVDLNQTVEKGDRLLVLEAMKMQSTVYAPLSGKWSSSWCIPARQSKPRNCCSSLNSQRSQIDHTVSTVACVIEEASSLRRASQARP